MNAPTTTTLAALLLVTACSREPHWVSVPDARTGEVIDLNSIAISGNVRTASFKVTYTTRASWDTLPEATRVTEILVRAVIACPELESLALYPGDNDQRGEADVCGGKHPGEAS